MYDEDFRKNNAILFIELLIYETQEKKNFFKTASEVDIKTFNKEFDEFLNNNENIIDENIMKYIDLDSPKIELNQYVVDKYKIKDKRIEIMREYFYIHLLDIFDNITLKIFDKNNKIKNTYRYDKKNYQFLNESNKTYTLCCDCKPSLLGSNKLRYEIMKYIEFNILGVKEENQVMFNIIDREYNKTYGLVEIPNFSTITYENIKSKLNLFDTLEQAKNRDLKYKEIRGEFGSAEKIFKITNLESNASFHDPEYIFHDGLIIGSISFQSDSYYQGYKTNNYKICFKLSNKSMIDKM